MASSAAKTRERAIEAAEQALADHHYVSLTDVLTGMRLLEPVHVESWRKGRLDYLLQFVQAGPERLNNAITAWYEWAKQKGLQPSEVSYTRVGRDGPVELRFTPDDDPEVARMFRTHFVSQHLDESRRRKLEAKVSEPPRPVVFLVRRDTQCSECGVAIGSGEMLFLDGKQALCLACAAMDGLEFLERGDTAMTRRATKYSGRSAVVVEFSRSRGRYERQGILAEPDALAKAEAECAADVPARAEARKRGVAARAAEDRKLVARMTEEILKLFPRCPPDEAARIAEWTATRGSGRVGRSAAGRKLDEDALTLAVRASVRHNHTPYDRLLAGGTDRDGARGMVADAVDEFIGKWGG